LKRRRRRRRKMRRVGRAPAVCGLGLLSCPS